MYALMCDSIVCSNGNWRRMASLAIALSLIVAGSAGLAQTATEPADWGVDEPLFLKPSVRLEAALPPVQSGKLPVFVTGERMSGRPDLESVVEGDVVLRKAGTVIRADRIEYFQPADQVKASG